MEIATTERYTPMAQDTKDGALRFIKHSKLDWNYGCIPRTWENPREEHDGFGGDNDPLDVVELSGRPLERGAVIPIKVWTEKGGLFFFYFFFLPSSLVNLRLGGWGGVESRSGRCLGHSRLFKYRASARQVLGVLGLIDEGECDYKVLAVDARDPRAHLVTDVRTVCFLMALFGRWSYGRRCWVL